MDTQNKGLSSVKTILGKLNSLESRAANPYKITPVQRAPG